MSGPYPNSEITDDIFEILADKESFSERFRQHANYYCGQCGYEPLIQDARVIDAYGAYNRDRKNAPNNLPKGSAGPDHFKLAGILVYWLKRFAPIYGLRNIIKFTDQSHGAGRHLLCEYPSELIAVNWGLAICEFFVNNREDAESKYQPDIDADYVADICLLLKHKNMSPHAVGFIFRSLFVPQEKIELEKQPNPIEYSPRA